MKIKTKPALKRVLRNKSVRIEDLGETNLINWSLLNTHRNELFEEQSNIVSSFSEKPQKGRAYINGGFMIFEKKLLDYLKKNKLESYQNVLSKLNLRK